MDETANSNANELYDPIIEAFDDGIANIVADSRQIPKRFSTLNILEMYSERCFQRGAFREVLSERCFQRGAFREVLSERCFQRGAFREVLSERCFRRPSLGRTP